MKFSGKLRLNASKNKAVNGAHAHIDKLVAGAGFEPTTFGL